MGKRLCPRCGSFSLTFEPGYQGVPDHYKCQDCGEIVPEEEIGVSLNPDSMQRFPSGKDATPKSPLNDFLERKKP